MMDFEKIGEVLSDLSPLFKAVAGTLKVFTVIADFIFKNSLTTTQPVKMLSC